jgi:hypothetical protein
MVRHVHSPSRAGHVARIEHRARYELDPETVERLWSFSGLEHPYLVAGFDEPPHEYVSEASAAASDER